MTNMQKRGTVVVNMLTSRSRPTERNTDSEWNELNRRIRDGRVIPIISNSFRLDAIFSDLILQSAAGQDKDSEDVQPVKMGSENLLSQVWAEKIKYPLPDTHDLARVSQFYRSKCKDDEEAKASYLNFLKESLLAYAENLGVSKRLIEELFERFHESTVTDLVQELELPKIKSGEIDPLHILARLPLPIFVTTSCHNFLERALLAENKQPITQTCFWNGGIGEISETSVSPTPQNPLVYHLFGNESFPKTMVLSEEDYLDFLVKVTQSVDTERPIIPVKLRSSLSVSSLILLGYRLQDWDFRVLFRGIVNPEQSPMRGFSLVIQLSPDQQFNITNVEEARKYLETYFQPKLFNVNWGSVDNFLTSLWDEWNKWRLGQ